jgi:hypothetical protein
MDKEFIPYEQAITLKELGFDEPCFGYYNGQDNYIGEEGKMNSNCNKLGMHGAYCTAPLYQQAFRWFREKHKLVFNFISYSIVKPGEYHWSITWNDEAKASGIVKTYEEAELACLIKLIEIVKNK